jgi:glycosyltransferase involved in cell wall biosynthesis
VTAGLPLRVAFVSHHPHMQMGGQRSMALLIEHLDRRVIAPLAICPGPGELTDHLTALDCPVVHIPLPRIKPRTLLQMWDSSRRIRALLRQRAIDVVAPDAAPDALTCGLAKLGTPTKMVWFVRMTAHNSLDRILERLADGFIGDSDGVRRRFSNSGAVSARYRTIVGGVDLRRFRPADDRAALRRALGIPADRFVLLFVGQVKRAKGVLDIVDALGRLHAAPPPGPRPLLVVVGTPDPPAILGEIEAQARAAGVSADLRVLPQQPDIWRWMQAADVLVSGSYQDTEGMSRVLYEAMACGAVPIATDIRGNRDAITPETGVLVPERAPADIARAVARLMTHPDEQAARAARGPARARERFDIRQHAQGVAQFYGELVRPLRT